MFKSPLGCRVQPYLDRDTVNGFNLIRFEEKVVLRTGLEKAVCKSLPFQADDRIIRAGSNNDLARQFGIVALFICNFKRDACVPFGRTMPLAEILPAAKLVSTG